MSTCVLYVDEAGNADPHRLPLPSGQTALFVLGGVALPLSEWRDIDREYLRLKRTYFSAEMENTKRGRPEHWEAKDLTQPRQRTSARRQAFLHEVLNLLQRWQAALFAITFLKNPSTPAPPMSMYTAGAQQLAQRFSPYIAEHPRFDHGIMIMDSRSRTRKGTQSDFQVGASYLSYIFGHETGRQFTNLMEAPLFADSRLTAGLQLAHHVASLVYGNHCDYHLRDLEGALDYSHLQQYWPRLAALEFRSRREYDGYIVRGFRRNDHRS